MELTLKSATLTPTITSVLVTSFTFRPLMSSPTIMSIVLNPPPTPTFLSPQMSRDRSKLSSLNRTMI